MTLASVLGWVRVPHWLDDGLTVCLYWFGQSFPHKLAFEVEPNESYLIYMISEPLSSIPKGMNLYRFERFGPSSPYELASEVELGSDVIWWKNFELLSKHRK